MTGRKYTALGGGTCGQICREVRSLLQGPARPSLKMRAWQQCCKINIRHGGMAFGARKLGFVSQLCHLLSVRSWAQSFNLYDSASSSVKTTNVQGGYED